MRALSVSNLYDKNNKTLKLTGDFGKVMGEPDEHGIWLIWGAEKNGKTRFALLLAKYLSTMQKVLYVSAEEGFDETFKQACIWAGIERGAKLGFVEYVPLAELRTHLKKHKSTRIVFLDNITIYADELKGGGLKQITKDHPKTLFIFLAHEERGEPYTAAGKMCRKLAKIVVHVQGLAAIVSARCPGGTLLIDEEKAVLYHGQDITNN